MSCRLLMVCTASVNVYRRAFGSWIRPAGRVGRVTVRWPAARGPSG